MELVTVTWVRKRHGDVIGAQRSNLEIRGGWVLRCEYDVEVEIADLAAAALYAGSVVDQPGCQRAVEVRFEYWPGLLREWRSKPGA